MVNKNKATLIGLIAIVLWSSLVGTIKIVSESFGATGGSAMIFSVATIFLYFTVGSNKIRDFSIRYIIWGALFFVSYQLCFSLSIGYASTGRQAIEVSMLNYLWPMFTILFSIIFNGQKTNLLIIPGLILPIIGIGWVLGDEQGFNFLAMLNNIKENPFSYGLALSGSIFWAAYSVITIKYSEGKNSITLFFLLTALTLWFKYLISAEESMTFSYNVLIYLVIASSAIGFGATAWNHGILYGNVTILAGASYFIPIISAFLSVILLHTSLTFSFWQGTGMVCIGAMLCWIATRNNKTTITKT